MSHAVHHITHSIGHFFHHAGHEIAHVWHKTEKHIGEIGQIVGAGVSLIPGGQAIGAAISGGSTLLQDLEKPKPPKISIPHAQSVNPIPSIIKNSKPKTTKQIQPIGQPITGVFQPERTSFFHGLFGEDIKGWGHDILGDIKSGVQKMDQKLGNFFSLL